MVLRRLQLFAVFCASLLGVARAASVSQETVENYHYHCYQAERPAVTRLAPEDFAILPWGWTPGDKQALQDLKDCGFNLAGFVAPEFVGAVRKAGLKCFVDDPKLSRGIAQNDTDEAAMASRLKQTVKPFTHNPAVFGYYFCDEPGSAGFERLGRWREALKQAAPTQSASYVNLLPIGAQGSTYKTYDDYLEAYINTVKPSFVSYDHYAFPEDGSMRDSFFKNLEAMRRVTQKHGLPFWNVILATGHIGYAEPTPASLRLQVFSTLAYGGRGISYYTYFSEASGNYRAAAVDQFLNKTPTWSIIQNINLQLHTLGPIYLKLKSVNVFHEPTVPEGCAGVSSSQLLEKISGGNLLVGEFIHADGRPFVLVVNKDLNRSTGFELKFKRPGALKMVNPYTGEEVPAEGTAELPWGGENRNLAPGQGALLTVR